MSSRTQQWEEEFEAAAKRPLDQRMRYAFIRTYKPVLDDERSPRTRWRNTGNGASGTCPTGSVMAAFEYRQAEEIRGPDGIERFEDAWNRRVEVDGFPVSHIDDIIGSKQAANRLKDRESLPRLLSFRDWLRKRGAE